MTELQRGLRDESGYYQFKDLAWYSRSAMPNNPAMPHHRTAGWIAGISLAISLGLVPWGWGDEIKDGGIKTVQAVILSLWILGPPIWFWYEYFFKFRKPPDPQPAKWPSFDEFKYMQDVSSKIWIAASSALLILYFWKDLKR